MRANYIFRFQIFFWGLQQYPLVASVLGRGRRDARCNRWQGVSRSLQRLAINNTRMYLLNLCALFSNEFLCARIHFIFLSGFYVAVHTCLSHWGNIGNIRHQLFTAFYASMLLFRIRAVCSVVVFLYNIHGIHTVIPKFIFGRCWLLKFFLKKKYESLFYFKHLKGRARATSWVLY